MYLRVEPPISAWEILYRMFIALAAIAVCVAAIIHTHITLQHDTMRTAWLDHCVELAAITKHSVDCALMWETGTPSILSAPVPRVEFSEPTQPRYKV